MARRRVQSNPFAEDPDILGGLSSLASMAMEGDELDVSGTAQDLPEMEGMYPSIPRDTYEGLDLVGNLAEPQPQEDYGIPDVGGLQDPLETIRYAVEQDPSLMKLLPEETRQKLRDTPADPMRRFVSEREQQEMAPAEEPEQEIAPTSFETMGGALRDYFSPTKRAEMSEQNRQLMAQARGEDLQEEQGEAPPIQEEMAEATSIPPAVEQVLEKGPVEEITEADLPQEGLEPMEGAVEALQADPKLQAAAMNLWEGMDPSFMPETFQLAQTISDSLTKRIEELNEQEMQMRQKMETGDMSTLDKMALGVALLAPVLIGLVYGKEGFLAALGGSLEGYGQSNLKQSEMQMKNLEKLNALGKEKRGLEKEKEQLKKDLLKEEINPELRKLLGKYDAIRMGQNEEGKPGFEIGKDAIQIGDKIGLSARDEQGVLYYDTDLLRDDKDVETFRKNSEEGRKVVQKLPETTDNIQRIVGLIDALKEQHPGVYKVIQDQYAGAIPGKTFDHLKVDLVDSQGNRQSVSVIPMLKQELGTLMDTYRTGFLSGTRFSEHFQEHFKEVMGDMSPTEFMKMDIDTMRSKAENFGSIIVNRIISDLAGQGFLKEPLEARFKYDRAEPRQGGRIRQEAHQQIMGNPDEVRKLLR